MEFTKEVLQQIARMGLNGLSFSRLAMELSMTPSELKKERLKNKKLDEALRDAEDNTESLFVSKLMESVIKNDRNIIAETQARLFIYLKEKTNT